MTELLMLLTFPEPVRREYEDALRAGFPEVTLRMVDHVDKLEPFIESAEVLMTFGPMLMDRAGPLLGRARNLKWIQALGTGVDNIADVPTLPDRVQITNIRGIHGAPVSEAALMAMLALSRGLPRTVRNQDRKAWERWPARLLDGKTVGILGVGQIAEVLAPKCKAFGMTVVGISSATRSLPGFDRMADRGKLAGAVGELDYLVLLTPYTTETRHLVNAKVLAAMKPTSYLINLARGGVVDEEALLQALQQKQIAGAALDVFSTEPLPATHPFWSLPNVIITPHMGGFCDIYARLALPTIQDNLHQFLKGNMQNMTNIVSRQAPV
ncbi:MAG: D-2-hydroxyacid dehydrogenase [Deltaproteobacteria bacterium]|nr:D-2-hydroxyacid dehydrogenase [Deltaproteobacteria bacterium]